MNSKLKTTFFSICLMATTLLIQAQDQALIYGKVTTIDGDSYEGQIRWGKEEAFWTDIFNGNKEDNENYRYLTREDRNQLRSARRERRWGNSWVSWSSGNDWETSHEFQARFGDI